MGLKMREFLQLESLSGILLFGVALLALVVSNSPWQDQYDHFFHLHFFGLALLEWINQGLMSLFFFLVGLEIKREIVQGELNSVKKVTLPAIAALGGMAVPALIYLLFNRHNAVNIRGWAIPSATDIAFALGIIRLLHPRVPLSLKVFLTALAIFDDLGAIVIIALFYSATLHWLYLVAAGALVGILVLLDRRWALPVWFYGVVGIGLWWILLQSGVHAVLAGVILALFIPLKDEHGKSPLLQLEHRLHPWVALGVLPIFGFANAGVSLRGLDSQMLLNPVMIGIALGLFVGKQLGIFLTTWLAVKLRLAPPLTHTDWRGVYGIAVLCGVGFTMSLFIGTLAFSGINGAYTAAVRLGVLGGSLLSGVVGYIILQRVFSLKESKA